MKINETLKFLRQSKALTQSEAAEKLGVSLSSYQKYEREKGYILPSLEVLCRIADFYGVTLDYLLNRDTIEPSVSEDMRRLITKLEAMPIEKQTDLINTLSALFSD